VHREKPERAQFVFICIICLLSITGFLNEPDNESQKYGGKEIELKKSRPANREKEEKNIFPPPC
jgi:hypothetical protein